MYIKDGIAYAGEKQENIEVSSVKVLDDLIMIVTFSTGEERIFDASYLLEYPAFASLKDEKIFKNAKVEYGVVVWNDGDIDIAPETMYKKSYKYESVGV
jgi:hypothetical protein